MGACCLHDDHGKTAYLTIEDLEKSAAVDGYTLDEVVQNLVETVEVARKEEGHAGPTLIDEPSPSEAFDELRRVDGHWVWRRGGEIRT